MVNFSIMLFAFFGQKINAHIFLHKNSLIVKISFFQKQNLSVLSKSTLTIAMAALSLVLLAPWLVRLQFRHTLGVFSSFLRSELGNCLKSFSLKKFSVKNFFVKKFLEKKKSDGIWRHRVLGHTGSWSEAPRERHLGGNAPRGKSRKGSRNTTERACDYSAKTSFSSEQ